MSGNLIIIRLFLCTALHLTSYTPMRYMYDEFFHCHISNVKTNVPPAHAHTYTLKEVDNEYIDEVLFGRIWYLFPTFFVMSYHCAVNKISLHKILLEYPQYYE